MNIDISCIDQWTLLGKAMLFSSSPQALGSLSFPKALHFWVPLGHSMFIHLVQRSARCVDIGRVPHKRLWIGFIVLDPELKRHKSWQILGEPDDEFLKPVDGRDVVRFDDTPVGEVCGAVLATEARDLGFDGGGGFEGDGQCDLFNIGREALEEVLQAVLNGNCQFQSKRKEAQRTSIETSLAPYAYGNTNRNSTRFNAGSSSPRRTRNGVFSRSTSEASSFKRK